LIIGVISNSSIAFLIADAASGASTLPIGVADVAPRRKNVLVAFVLGHTIAS
jgi:enoyl-[acyl-carrier-protein] reductase (NADH)